MASGSIRAEAVRLYHLPLEELGALADRRRQLRKAPAYSGRGNDIVTYIIDRNINYTNVCNVHCKFCAFYRTEKDTDAYVISLPEMDQKIEETIALRRHANSAPGRASSQTHEAMVSRSALAHAGQVSASQHSRVQPQRVHPFSRRSSRNRSRRSSPISAPRASAPSRAAAARFSWTASASASRPQSDER